METPYQVHSGVAGVAGMALAIAGKVLRLPLSKAWQLLHASLNLIYQFYCSQIFDWDKGGL